MDSYRHTLFDCGIYNSATSQFHNQVISDFMFAHILLGYLTKRRVRTNYSATSGVLTTCSRFLSR
jgi:hypothetical protein